MKGSGLDAYRSWAGVSTGGSAAPPRGTGFNLPKAAVAPSTNQYLLELQERQLKARQQNLQLKAQLARNILGNQGQQQQPQANGSALARPADMPTDSRNQTVNGSSNMMDNRRLSTASTADIDKLPQGSLSAEPRTQQKRKSGSRMSENEKNSNALDFKEIGQLLSKISELVDDNKEALVTAKAKIEEANNTTRDNNSNENIVDKDYKKKVAKLLKKFEKKDAADSLMPRWRHALLGESNPQPHQVLKGIKLFRVIAWGLVIMIIRPDIAITRRRGEAKKRDKDHLRRLLNVHGETCALWLAKHVKLPLLSIEQDLKLDFEPNDHLFVARAPLRTRLLQLKVRAKGVIDSLHEASSKLLDEASTKLRQENDGDDDIKEFRMSKEILEFLSLLIDDGNYLGKDYLWPVESRALEFSKLGATTNVLKEATGDKDYSNQNNIITVELNIGDANIQTVHYEASRARLLLKHFIITRVLIGKVMLSPWHYSICPAPTGEKLKKCMRNYRVLASVMYEIHRNWIIFKDNENLPQVTSLSRQIGMKANGDRRPSLVRLNSVAAAISSGEGNGNTSSANFNGEESAVLRHNESAIVLGPKKNTSLFQRVMTFLTSHNAEANLEEEELEKKLVASTRPPFESLDRLHFYLRSWSDFSAIESHLVVWMEEYSRSLDAWIDEVLEIIIKYRNVKKSMKVRV